MNVTELKQLREKMQADPSDDEVALAIMKLVYPNPTEKQATRVKRALGGSIDSALSVLERALPNRVVQIVLSRQVHPSVAISPAPPFPEDPPMYKGYAVTAGEAILVAMMEAIVHESADKAAGPTRVAPRQAPATSTSAPAARSPTATPKATASTK